MAFDAGVGEATNDEFASILRALAMSQSAKRVLTLLDLGLNFTITYSNLTNDFLDLIGSADTQWTLGLKGCSLLLGREIEQMKNRNQNLSLEIDPFLLYDNSDESVHALLQDYMSAEPIVM
jgi:hypothetical protein